MGILDKYNTGKMFEFDNKKERPFINLKGLQEVSGDKTTHKVHAIFINHKSKYGKAPVVVTDDYQVNLPQHLTEICEQMRVDDDLVDLANERKLGFEIYTYMGEYGVGYSVNWIEM